MVAHTFTPCIPGLYNEFQASYGSVVRPLSKTKQKACFVSFLCGGLFEIGCSYVDHPGLKVKRSACLCFPCTGVTGVHHHTQVNTPVLNDFSGGNPLE